MVNLWIHDNDKFQNRNRRSRDVNDEELFDRKRKQVLGLVEAGQVSKAMQRITSNGVADLIPVILLWCRNFE